MRQGRLEQIGDAPVAGEGASPPLGTRQFGERVVAIARVAVAMHMAGAAGRAGQVHPPRTSGPTPRIETRR